MGHRPIRGKPAPAAMCAPDTAELFSRRLKRNSHSQVLKNDNAYSDCPTVLERADSRKVSPAGCPGALSSIAGISASGRPTNKNVPPAVSLADEGNGPHRDGGFRTVDAPHYVRQYLLDKLLSTQWSRLAPTEIF